MKNCESGVMKEKVRSYNLPRTRTARRPFLIHLFRRGEISLAKGRVLVIEGDEISRTRLCLMLASCGYEPLVPDGHLGHICRAGSFDAAIVDMHCPIAAASVKTLMQSGSGVRILASGFDPENPEAAEMGRAFSGILKKPYRINNLKRVLHEAVSAPSSSSELRDSGMVRQHRV
jgi:hypothetical protein